MAEKQTAGRDNLGDFAPKFAELNDDVLFGEVWSREDKMSAHDRSLITVASLMTQGVPQLEAHMKTATNSRQLKTHITKTSMSVKRSKLPRIIMMSAIPNWTLPAKKGT